MNIFTITLPMKVFARIIFCSFSDKRCILCKEQETCAFHQWFEEMHKEKERKKQ
jgi:hypothetical protein